MVERPNTALPATGSAGSVVIVGVTGIPGAARWALDELRDALTQRGWRAAPREAAGPEPTIVVGLGSAPGMAQCLAESSVSLPEAAESLAIKRARPDLLILAGRDERGLIYALTEAARAIELEPGGADPFGGVIESRESPELGWRSMQLFLYNADLEREWYFCEAWWDAYVKQLLRYRYNNLSLTFGHQTSYLAPPYPFHVPLPEFPKVRVPGLSDTQREMNLAMLRRIAEMAHARGLHFTLGVWSQHDCGYGPPMVEGLDEDIRAECNALGLRRLLEACPAIDGVQFRMNVESGVPERNQLYFYELQFRAIAECGRPIRLDLRAKGLANDTVALARRIVPYTVVSTKFWCEHLGQPYVMPAIQSADIHHYRRYGTWDLLRKPRAWELFYRLWSVGTQRVLLWGDPAWVRRFVQSCHFGGKGFEVMAPLSSKGVGNQPGLWRVIPDPAYQPYAAEYQRYWMFYLLFGRIGYRSDCPAGVWLRELRHRFGDAAGAVACAYRLASGVMPLLTTVLQWSASTWTYWPEMFAGRTLPQDIQVQPSDPTQFYGVTEYVGDALADRLCGKWCPPRVAQRFRELARDTRSALECARESVGSTPSAEFRGTELDLSLLADMGDYHACRLEAGTHLAVFERTQETGRLVAGLNSMRRARQHWQALSDRADGIYHGNLVFGDFGEGHAGHWKGKLGIVDADIRWIEEKLESIPAEQRTALYRQLPGESLSTEPPSVHCALPASARAGRDLALGLTIAPADQVRGAILYHRSTNQTLPFASVAMRALGGGGFEGTVPGTQIDRHWDLMVFFEVRLTNGESFRWPDWRSRPPYGVIEIS